LLLVSGGHSQFVAVEGVGAYRRLGGTIDDALGESFDKAAKLLGLAYPGGPEIERLAKSGDPKRFDLPRPLIGRPGADFSFSGLKTALRLAAEAVAPLGDSDIADLAASFQAAIVDVIVDRTRNAMETFRRQGNRLDLPLEGRSASFGEADFGRGERKSPDAPSTLVIAGGVAANRAIRAALQNLARERGFRLVAPPIRLCSDNAVMIAWAGAERLALGLTDPLDAPARPRWPLDESAPSLRDAGAKGGRP
jgi:N6-L-threonylcarbamoyladenine synthase